MKQFILPICLLSLLVGTLATYGVDMSIYQGAVSASTFSCMKNAGFDFAIIQVVDGGSINTNCPYTVSQAWAGGMAHVDIYAFLCPYCGSDGAAGQVSQLTRAFLP